MPIKSIIQGKYIRTGFSLTEMLIVISLLGIIISLAFPNYLIILERSRAREGEQTLLTLYAANLRYKLDHGGASVDSVSGLDVDIRTSVNFNPPVYSGSSISIDRKSGIYKLTIDISRNVPEVKCTHGTDSSVGLSWCNKLTYSITA